MFYRSSDVDVIKYQFRLFYVLYSNYQHFQFYKTNHKM